MVNRVIGSFISKYAAQQCVQADLAVRTALEPLSRRQHFSVSTFGPPTKPLVQEDLNNEAICQNKRCSNNWTGTRPGGCRFSLQY